jgi:protein-S-isoprenylcysteine O-methyltransferase Ste14
VDAPKRLVVRGLYRYSRNPKYVGVLTAILGWLLWYQAAGIVGYFLLVATLFQSFVVFYEEPHLKRVFAET